MASWHQLKNFVGANFDATEITPRALRLATTWHDRGHMVWVTLAQGPDGESWAQIDSPIGARDSIDLVRALALVEGAACGGLCQMSAGGEELVSIRHCVPLDSLDTDEFIKPLMILNAAGAAFKYELAGSAEPSSTELGKYWWFALLDRMAEGRGQTKTVELTADNLDKLRAITEHSCGAYIARYCDVRGQRAYAALLATPAYLPWEVVSLTAGLNADPAWRQFVVTNVRASVEHFVELFIDPSLFERSSGPPGPNAEFQPTKTSSTSASTRASQPVALTAVAVPTRGSVVNTTHIVCPSCGTKNRADRTTCFECSTAI